MFKRSISNARSRGRPRERHRAVETPPRRKRKRAVDVDEVFRLMRIATAPYKKAAMFELAQRGFDSVFQVLVGCIISIRTLDEVSLPTAIRLLERAPMPADMAALTVSEIDALIHDCSFHTPKSQQIRQIAQRTVRDFAGELPCDFELLRSFHGVGPKCANLALGIACGRAPGISVDIHVHRVTNRRGLVRTATPEKTMAALMHVLPRRYWVEINKLLVPFGKHLCTGAAPKCSTCPLLRYCQQIGVSNHR
jgi:endonuclease-3